jgi:hypothetical protein
LRKAPIHSFAAEWTGSFVLQGSRSRCMQSMGCEVLRTLQCAAAPGQAHGFSAWLQRMASSTAGGASNPVRPSACLQRMASAHGFEHGRRGIEPSQAHPASPSFTEDKTGRTYCGAAIFFFSFFVLRGGSMIPWSIPRAWVTLRLRPIHTHIARCISIQGVHK